MTSLSRRGRQKLVLEESHFQPAHKLALQRTSCDYVSGGSVVKIFACKVHKLQVVHSPSPSLPSQDDTV